MKNRERIDKMLVERGLAESRTKAQALVMAGVVLVDELRIEKPSQEFGPDVAIRIKGRTEETKYASRAGLKLEKALSEFDIRPGEYVCLDVGASTGGFTDCLLVHGARKVIAVDVGTNQLIWRLRDDARVEAREKVNARYLERGDFGVEFDLIVMDVSFISVTKILPALAGLMTVKTRLVVLIKPQFEVGKGEVGKGGIVRDAEKQLAAVEKVNEFAVGIGLDCGGVIESPILGADGNKEFLAHYRLSGNDGSETEK